MRDTHEVEFAVGLVEIEASHAGDGLKMRC